MLEGRKPDNARRRIFIPHSERGICDREMLSEAVSHESLLCGSSQLFQQFGRMNRFGEDLKIVSFAPCLLEEVGGSRLT